MFTQEFTDFASHSVHPIKASSLPECDSTSSAHASVGGSSPAASDWMGGDWAAIFKSLQNGVKCGKHFRYINVIPQWENFPTLEGGQMNSSLLEMQQVRS